MHNGGGSFNVFFRIYSYDTQKVIVIGISGCCLTTILRISSGTFRLALHIA